MDPKAAPAPAATRTITATLRRPRSVGQALVIDLGERDDVSKGRMRPAGNVVEAVPLVG